MRALFLTLCFSLLGLVSWAQLTQTIRGRVVDKDSKQPLIGANVVIVNSDPFIGNTADVEGYFKLEGIPIGRVAVKVSFIGYEEVLLPSVELNSSKEAVLQIEMQESAILGEEVVVTADRDKTETLNQMSTVSARTFSVEESQRYAGSLNDVSRMAQNFAGVGIVNDQRNDLIIRGNSSFGVLYRLEGIDIPNPNHFSFQGSTGGPISILNNNVLSNSDFFTGAFPAEYGNAYAGAFDLHLRNGNDEKHEFLGQIGFNGAELMAEGPLSRKSRASYLVNYRYSTLELFKVMGLSFGTVAVPQYQDGNFHINLPDKHGKWDIFGLAGISNIAFLDAEKDPDDTFFDDQGEDLYYGTSMAAAGLSRTQLIGSKSYLKATLSWSYNGRSIINDTLNVAGDAFNVYKNNSTEGKYSLMLMFNKKFNARHTTRIGSFNDLLYFNMDEKFWVQSNQDYFTRSDFSGTTWLLQPFVQHQYRPGEKWTVNGGVHFLVFLLNESFTIEPRLGIKYKAAPRLTLGAAYGRHGQLPPMLLYFRKTQTASGAGTIRNQDLKPLLSDHYVVSADYRISEQTHVKVEAYYQVLSQVPIDSLNTTYSVLNQGANFDFSYPQRLVNEGSGKNYGIEITLERFLNRGFYYLLTASIFNSEYTAQNGKSYNTAFNGNQAYTLLAGKEWRLTKNQEAKNQLKLTIDARLAYAGGLRYTPLNQAATDLTGFAVYDYNQHFERKYPDYFRPDLRIALKMNGKKVTQEWAVDLQNIINRKNIFSREFSPTSLRLEDRYQLGFLPVLLYRIYF